MTALDENISVHRYYLKVFLVVCLFALFIVTTWILRAMTVGDVRRRVGAYMTTFWVRFALNVLEVDINSLQIEPLKKKEPTLIVSNHLSYLDILIIASIRPTVFISSKEVEKTFFLGFLAKLGGTIFVERRNKTTLKRDMKYIEEKIRLGFTVCLFPEGTTGNGEKVLPFRSALFSSAFNAEARIVPVCLRYTEIDGKPFDENSDRVCWYGDMTFAPHFNGILKTESIKADFTVLDEISGALKSERKQVADYMYQRISNYYQGETNAA